MNNQASRLLHSLVSGFKTQERVHLPQKLHRKIIYIFPTRQGFVFFAMLIALLIGSINHNNNLGFILTFLLGSMSFVSIFHTYKNISGITIVSAKAKPVFAGQPAVFKLGIQSIGQNHQALSFYFKNNKNILIDLEPGQTVYIDLPHTTEIRGILKPEVFYISSVFPLGLFRGWSKILFNNSCLIYPKPIPGPLIVERDKKNGQDEGESGGSGTDDFAGLDTYQRGDPLRHISWKSFSRGQGLYTKKFVGIQGKTIYFNADNLKEQNFETRMSRICHMILTAEAKQIPYGLKIGSVVIQPGLGGMHKKNCLRELALAVPK